MHAYRILVSIISLCFTVLAAATAPRLTVVVIVEGLTQDNLDEMRPYWDAGGLKQLSEEAFQTTLSFPHTVYGGCETVATLMTGTTPQRHGIESDTVFCRSTRYIEDVLYDEQTEGIGTSAHLSPRALMAASVTDQWRMRYGTDAHIYAIGVHSHPTILMAGHAANACCWLDPDSLTWVTSSFYPEGLPTAADRMNISGYIDQSCSRNWTPRLDIAMYNHPTPGERKHPFNYNPRTLLPLTPMANSLVVELALSLQQDQQLGLDNTPDLILLDLHARSPKATGDAIASAEQEDIYLWLNQDLGYLMHKLDQRVGRTEYQLVLIGRPSLGYSPLQLQSASIATPAFQVDRAAALTSTYLMALYGHERWVDGGWGPYIYLNRQLIEQKRLSLPTIRRQVADFLMDFEGVQVAYPIQEALLSDLAPSIYPKRAGDVVYQLQDVMQTTPPTPLMLWSGAMRPFPQGPLCATDVVKIILQ